MRKICVSFILMLFTISAHAQINFEKGYIIFNEGERIECLIRNIDWKDNPKKIEYKLNDDIKRVTAKNILEFGIGGFSKYISRNVAIDRSSENSSSLSHTRAPEFNNEQLFLKVLIEGDASLFTYSEGSIRRYFYKTSKKEIEQLVFKSYLLDNLSIAKNHTFRYQLLDQLKCSNVTRNTVERLQYTKTDLVDFFISYNSCTGNKFKHFKKDNKSASYSLTIRPGLNISNIYVRNLKSKTRSIDFIGSQGFRFGIEAGLTLPFNKNKWELLLEPTYRKLSTKEETPYHIGVIDYNVLELAFSLRYYMYLNNVNKLFMNTSFVYDIYENSTFNHSKYGFFEVPASSALNFGVGYKHKKKYSFELRFQPNKPFLGANYSQWKTTFTTISAVLGYSVF